MVEMETSFPIVVAGVIVFVASLVVARTLEQRDKNLVAISITLPLEQETP